MKKVIGDIIAIVIIICISKLVFNQDVRFVDVMILVLLSPSTKKGER